MSIVGRIESLWRYPVKSMRGEELVEAFVGFSGIYGDRLFAFTSTGCPKDFPYLTGREQREMLLYRARFRHPEKAARPPDLAETEALSPNLNSLPADPADLAVEVETPTGEVLGVDDPALIHLLAARMGGDGHSLTLVRSERALTDCLPVSLFSVQTARQLGEEIGAAIDKRRFRANVYLDLEAAPGFAEDRFVSRTLRLGPKVKVAVLERDSRCKMITIDPDTVEPSGAILRQVSRAHEGMAGVYAAVLSGGMVHRGDEVELLN
jgi:uncharacterized protein YcbX